MVTYSASKTLADRPAGGPTHAMTNGHSFPFFPKRIEEEENLFGEGGGEAISGIEEKENPPSFLGGTSLGHSAGCDEQEEAISYTEDLCLSSMGDGFHRTAAHFFLPCSFLSKIESVW